MKFHKSRDGFEFLSQGNPDIRAPELFSPGTKKNLNTGTGPRKIQTTDRTR